MEATHRNADRFTGFAELYDAYRPAPPSVLGPLLACYAGVPDPVVVDIGSGTGLSSRWASTWAARVVGVEPSDDMRLIAGSRPQTSITYRSGFGHATGLDDDVADIVLVVQAMHWMEPGPTLAEIARLLRPGGVLAVVDADWPPVAGIAGAEQAWITLHRRTRALEARASRGATLEELRRPVSDDDPDLVDDDLVDPHRNRAMPGDVRSWSKSEHLSCIVASGHFEFGREIVLAERYRGGADRFVALARSQGSYQGLLRLGLSESDIGVDEFDRIARAAFAASPTAPELSFSWRVRLGITAVPPRP